MTEPQQFLIYQSEDGSIRIDVMLEAENLWLNQKQLTELFGKAKGTISEHIKHIFELEGFLTLNDCEILRGAGKVSAELARGHAEQEFSKFRVSDDQYFESDFDQMMRQLPTKKPEKED